jgi:hypothetical protein
MCLVGSKIAAAIVRQAVAGAGVTRAGCRGATPGAARKWVEADGTMLSEAGEHLLGLISALRAGICVPCSAQMMERTREDALKATKQLILNGQGAGHPRALRHLRVMAARHGSTSSRRLTPPPALVSRPGSSAI